MGLDRVDACCSSRLSSVPPASMVSSRRLGLTSQTPSAIAARSGSPEVSSTMRIARRFASQAMAGSNLIEPICRDLNIQDRP